FSSRRRHTRCLSDWSSDVCSSDLAERLLLELKGKLGVDTVSGVAVNRPRPMASDVMTALLALGYSDKEAQLAVKHLPEGLSVSRSEERRVGKECRVRRCAAEEEEN